MKASTTGLLALALVGCSTPKIPFANYGPHGDRDADVDQQLFSCDPREDGFTIMSAQGAFFNTVVPMRERQVGYGTYVAANDEGDVTLHEAVFEDGRCKVEGAGGQWRVYYPPEALIPSLRPNRR